MTTWPEYIPYKLKDASLFRHASLVGTNWIETTAQSFAVHDPCNNAVIGRVPDLTANEVHEAIDVAHKAFLSYRKVLPRQRKTWLRNWSELIKENASDLAAICTLELGKPLKESLGTVKYGTDFLDWFESETEHLYGETIPAAKSDNRIITIREPQGVVAALTPWNSPVAMITRKAGAAIAAGNTVVCKPAPETPYCAIALAVLFERAGFPPGVFNVVTTQSNTVAVGREMCENRLVKHLSFTGSTAIGKLLNQQCAPGLKKVSFELGGLAPFIVFDDANLDKAVEGLIASRFRSSGQTCVCAQRLYIQKGVSARFIEKLVAALKVTFNYGSVWDPETSFGPLYSEKAVAKVRYHIDDALSKGARCALELSDPDDKRRTMVRPIIITGVTKDMAIANEETFGPVLGVAEFETEEEVLVLANDTETGLAGYFYTESIDRLWRVSEALQVGMVGCRVGLISACEQPFGGIKESGIGREGSLMALQEYVNVKSITIGL